MKVTQVFETKSRQYLWQIWENIAYDVFQVEKDCGDGRTSFTGEELRWMVPDFVDPHRDREWYEAWKKLPVEERERLIYLTFPKESRFGI